MTNEFRKLDRFSKIFFPACVVNSTGFYLQAFSVFIGKQRCILCNCCNCRNSKPQLIASEKSRSPLLQLMDWQAVWIHLLNLLPIGTLKEQDCPELKCFQHFLFLFPHFVNQTIERSDYRIICIFKKKNGTPYRWYQKIVGSSKSWIVLLVAWRWRTKKLYDFK